MMFLHSIVLYCFTIWLLKVEKHVIQLIFKKTIFETYISLFIIDILDNFFFFKCICFICKIFNLSTPTSNEPLKQRTDRWNGTPPPEGSVSCLTGKPHLEKMLCFCPTTQPDFKSQR